MLVRRYVYNSKGKQRELDIRSEIVYAYMEYAYMEYAYKESLLYTVRPYKLITLINPASSDLRTDNTEING